MFFHSLTFWCSSRWSFRSTCSSAKTRFMNAWLLLASYFFYAWWNPVFLLLIVATTLVDFLVVRQMEASPRRKLWLALSLTSNLGALAFFKYVGFFTRNLNGLLSFVGAPGVPVLDPVLPLGISFFTFQSNQLRDRRLPRGRAGRAQPDPLRHVRLVLPPDDLRPDLPRGDG
jgi:D-alanyl-lipoteichoic acid acyltransferase DltB (MBOAT superfamily)